MKLLAFHLQGNFITQSEDLVDGNQKAQYSAIVANRWLAIRLETVGNLIIFCSALLAVLGRNDLTPGKFFYVWFHEKKIICDFTKFCYLQEWLVYLLPTLCQ